LSSVAFLEQMRVCTSGKYTISGSGFKRQTKQLSGRCCLNASNYCFDYNLEPGASNSFDGHQLYAHLGGFGFRAPIYRASAVTPKPGFGHLGVIFDLFHNVSRLATDI